MNRIRSIALILALPVAAMADIVSTATVNAGQNFNFDTGNVVASGGDIQFTATQITFLGSAKGGNLSSLSGSFSGTSGYNGITPTILQGLAQFATNAPIPNSTITAGTSNGSVIALLTNGGNGAKILVTAISSSSISFQFTTYGATGGGGGGPAAPTITAVHNNSSDIPDGFPNSGVTGSTLIVIKGKNMADPNAQAVLQDSSKSGGLPTTLNGASANVQAGGKTYPLGLYYAIATQLAAVLPAGVPVGTVTITVTYNGQTSAPFTFKVVPTAFGIDVYNGNTAVVQDSVTGAIITPTNSAKGGQILTTWGTGLLANPADSDTTYTTSPHAISVQVEVYVGGVQANDVRYVGASVYPGVHIIVFTMPQGVPNGCYVPLAIVTHAGGTAVVSNMPTFAVSDSGGVCKESQYNLDGNKISQLNGTSSLKTGLVAVAQSTSPGSNNSPQTTNSAFASFQQVTGSSFSPGAVSVGACTVFEISTANGVVPTIVGLNAGTGTLTGPGGTSVSLQTVPTVLGSYFAQLSAGAVPSSGGAFNFHFTGASGPNTVGGPFDAGLTFPPLFTWTNQPDFASFDHTAGATFKWNNGPPGTFMEASGSSTANGVTGSFFCKFPAEAGQGFVPPFVTMVLPAGSGTSSLSNWLNYQTFTAPGLDYGYSVGYVNVSVNSTVR